MRSVRFLRNLLYSLKRQYGAKVVFYKTTASDFDPNTGKRTTTRIVVPIEFAIIMPDALANKFAYEHSYLMANRQFTFGAQWNQRQRLIVIDGEDLPKNFTIEIETSLIFDEERYVVRKADKFDFGSGYILTVTRADNNLPLQIQSLNVRTELCIGQSTGTQ